MLTGHSLTRALFGATLATALTAAGGLQTQEVNINHDHNARFVTQQTFSFAKVQIDGPL